MSTDYSLNVIRVHDVIWRSKLHRKLPDLYVEVRLGEVIKQTRTIKKSISPSWNDTLSFSSSDASIMLNLQVKHESAWTSNPCVGYVDIQLDDLLKKCSKDEAQLSLLPPPEKGNASSVPTGVIHLRLQVVDALTRACIDVDAAERGVQQRGIARSARDADSTLVAFADGALQSSEDGDLYQSLGSLILKLDDFIKFVDALSEVHPYLNAAWHVTSALYKVVSKQFETDKKIVGLVRTMEGAFDFVRDIQSLPEKARSLEQSIVELLKQTTECCLFVREYTRHGFAGRMLKSSNGGKIEEFEKSLSDVKKAIDSGNIVHTAFVSSRVSQKLDALLLQQALNPSPTDAFGRPICLPGTRIKTRQQIIDLLLSETSQNIVWLYGVAGSGKSTVSMTIAEYFRGISRLGVFLSFERGKSQPSSVIRTIAFALASFDSSIAMHITTVVEQDKSITMASAASQFEKLLLSPLKAAAATASGPIIIVLDALDECGTVETRKELMRLFRERFHELPSNFRFLISSRPENDIVRALSTHPNSVHEIELDYTSDDSRRDVLAYIRHEMHEILKMNPEVEIPKDWPWDANLGLIGNSAGGLFIWAFTAVKLVSSSDNPFRKLKDLVSDSQSLAPFGLDELYTTALRGSGIVWGDVGSKDRFAKVLAVLLYSKISLSSKTIDRLLGFPPDEPSDLILSRLRCLLAYAPGEPIRLFHASFSDYLVSPERSADPWFIDISVKKNFLLTRCFAVMEDMLHFNICDLETSFVRNDDVSGLEKCIKDNIPPHLDYACLFWVQHLRDVPYSPALYNSLSTFVYQRLLFWFEVLSLLKQFSRVASQALLDAMTWTAVHDADISSLLGDARGLATVFAAPITQSTPHIYMSVLPLTKEDSRISAHYSKQISSMVRVDRRGYKAPSLWLEVLEGHTDPVWSVDFSCDGKRIVSGSQDRMVRIWDAENGEAVGEPFEGHTSGVTSVAFSPDGTHVVSGSRDKTIRIWETGSGDIIFGPLEGHSGGISSVAFSPDGTRIVSGSYDKTVRVWDAHSGEIASGPFIGHMDTVSSVAFSPNGRSVVSASWDKTIRVWDEENGKVISRPFEGHTASVLSVAFSPDGTRIVSGSWDKTIRIWDRESGKVVSGPFEGHTDHVWSVSFSPDGARVVSGSRDQTIMIWDATNGNVISGPFGGHTASVRCVAFSPDGRRVVSSSRDRTIRIWGTERDTVVSGPPGGDAGDIMSVAFSPNGTRVASGSQDKRIRVWDAVTGEVVSGPFEGHRGTILSVTFSPDGTRIASGSWDNTIMIWDAESGEVVCGPLEGHKKSARSVAFSPDGTRVVSGSLDKTIRLWDAKSGEIISGPFKGHTGGVSSVAFSPDGTRVVSGSRDETIRVWDVQSGKPVIGPFRGHSDTIWSVAFSPDGTLVASGSSDKTLRIWDAESGNVISGPFKGHTDSILSVAFSPDGMRVASGSWDKTIMVWDTKSGEVVSGPFEGHTDAIWSVSFSPDGTRIVSGSEDNTIRIWKTNRGQIDSEPFKRHRDGNFASYPDSEGFSKWTLTESGWILGEQRELLLWVPPDLRPTLWRPQNTAIFGCPSSTKLDFRNTAHGARWRECFQPPP